MTETQAKWGFLLVSRFLMTGLEQGTYSNSFCWPLASYPSGACYDPPSGAYIRRQMNSESDAAFLKRFDGGVLVFSRGLLSSIFCGDVLLHGPDSQMFRRMR